MMTLDTQHVHILYILGFARIDLTYLEQIPKAIFVPKAFHIETYISSFLTSIDGKSFTWDAKSIFD